MQWTATTTALTNRVIRLLYGPGEGTDTVNISVYVCSFLQDEKYSLIVTEMDTM